MFSLRRFLRLAAAHWAEQRRGYLWFLGVGIMLHVVLLIIIFANKDGYQTLSTTTQATIYYSGLFLLAPIFAGRYFTQMARRQSGLLVLMRPASSFEKWLLAVLFIVVAYPLSYTFAFYLCDVPAWLIAHAKVVRYLAEHASLVAAGTDTQVGIYRLELSNYALFHPLSDGMTVADLLQIGVVLSTLQAFAIFGSLFFRNAPFIKTLFAGFLIMLAIIFLSAALKTTPDLLFDFWESERPMSGLQLILFPALWVAVPLLLWLSTYLALREREIAP